MNGFDVEFKLLAAIALNFEFQHSFPGTTFRQQKSQTVLERLKSARPVYIEACKIDKFNPPSQTFGRRLGGWCLELCLWRITIWL